MKTATKTILAAGALALLGSAAMAEDKAVKLGYSGFVDTYYGFNTVSKIGEFKLNMTQLELTASDEASGAKGVVDISTVGTNSNAGFDQAYVEKAFGPLTARLGQFYTHVGYEVIPTVKNANVTTSLPFAYEPTTHQGLFVTYATPLEGLSASVLVANSSRSDLKDYGAQVAYAKGIVSTYLNYYLQAVPGQSFYNDVNTGAPVSQVENMHYLNFIASVNVLDNLSVAGEYLYRTQLADSEKLAGTDTYASQYPDGLSPKDQGYALYAKYSLGDFSVAPRVSFYFLPDAGNKQLGQYTLTLKQKFGPAFTAYAEGSVATDSTAAYVGSAVEGQGTVLLGGSFAF